MRVDVFLSTLLAKLSASKKAGEPTIIVYAPASECIIFLASHTRHTGPH
jgi:hypothetical protein